MCSLIPLLMQTYVTLPNFEDAACREVFVALLKDSVLHLKLKVEFENFSKVPENIRILRNNYKGFYSSWRACRKYLTTYSGKLSLLTYCITTIFQAAFALYRPNYQKLMSVLAEIPNVEKSAIESLNRALSDAKMGEKKQRYLITL